MTARRPSGRAGRPCPVAGRRRPGVRIGIKLAGGHCGRRRGRPPGQRPRVRGIAVSRRRVDDGRRDAERPGRGNSPPGGRGRRPGQPPRAGPRRSRRRPRRDRAAYAPFLEWRDVVARAQRRRTGLPVVVENDVNALTVAEQWFGAGVDVGLIRGRDDRRRGRMRPRHRRRARTRRGRYGRRAGPCADRAGRARPVAAATPAGRDPGADAAILAGGRTDTAARTWTSSPPPNSPGTATRRPPSVYGTAGRCLGRALATVANLLNPERIVLSGEGLAASDCSRSAARQSFYAHAFGQAAECELVIRPLPERHWAGGRRRSPIQHLFLGLPPGASDRSNE